MTFNWFTDLHVLFLNRVSNLWYPQILRLVADSFFPSCNSFCPLNVTRHLCYRDLTRNIFWQNSGVWKTCPNTSSSHRSSVLLNTSSSIVDTSTCPLMSRIKSTLETVSKAVSGTQAEIFSKISWFKQSAGQEKTVREAISEGSSLKDKNNGASAATPKLIPPPLSSSATLSPVTTPETSSPLPQDVHQQKETKTNTSISHATTSSSTTTEAQSKSSTNVTTVSKQTTPLFHPSSFSINLDETYNYLAHHVNAYFSSYTKAEEGKKKDSNHTEQPSLSLPDQHQQNTDRTTLQEPAKDQIISSPPAPDSAISPKKGFGHYLVSSAPTVQAFVGSYIAPLVPRFKTEPKALLSEGDKPPPVDDSASKQKESAENKEQKAVDEKARRLLLQREKIIARVSVDNRTRALVRALRRAPDVRLYISRVEELSLHLLEFPESRVVAVKENVIPFLLRLRQAGDPSLKAAVREALALVGYIDPVKSKGIRILSIDGGGTRGLVALQTLQKLEELSGKPIYQLFDYICGVSTGAILGFMLGVLQIPLRDCEELYKKLSSDVFNQNVIVGTVKMGWSHAFYDTEVWEKVLKEKMGSDIMIETSRNPECPKVAAVSTVVNKGTPVKGYVFRNYNLPYGIRSHYRGDCKHKMWEAIRASSAAPGYFQEFVLGTDLHQDGGLLLNNPTALAIHECQCLWPGSPLQCVVSLGTGRFQNDSKNVATYTSLKTKITNVINSATDTEEVHTMLDALLPPHTYFRFNPHLSEDVALDERRSEKLNLLQVEGIRYLERNEEKLQRAVRTLVQEKGSIQRFVEWVRLRASMSDRLAGILKL